MCRRGLFAIALFLAAVIGPETGLAIEELSTVTAVANLDPQRYAGAWYEIARLPNFFQRQCARSAVATYTPLPDGQIGIGNRCSGTDGRMSETQGIARIPNTAQPARWEISFVGGFGVRLFWRDYWIIGLTNDYRYAIVGTPSRRFAWILSRTPQLGADDLQAALELLRRQGYDPKAFVLTPQPSER